MVQRAYCCDACGYVVGVSPPSGTSTGGADPLGTVRYDETRLGTTFTNSARLNVVIWSTYGWDEVETNLSRMGVRARTRTHLQTGSSASTGGTRRLEIKR